MLGGILPQDLLLANEEGDGQRRSVGCLIFLSLFLDSWEDCIISQFIATSINLNSFLFVSTNNSLYSDDLVLEVI